MATWHCIATAADGLGDGRETGSRGDLIVRVIHKYELLIFIARCYAERGYATVSRLSVRLSVTLRYDFHIGWNSSKITSRPNSLRPLLWLTPT